jgi:hypothetical protein
MQEETLLLEVQFKPQLQADLEGKDRVSLLQHLLMEAHLDLHQELRWIIQ